MGHRTGQEERRPGPLCGGRPCAAIRWWCGGGRHGPQPSSDARRRCVCSSRPRTLRRPAGRMHRVPVSLVLLIATAAASTANMPTSTAGKGAGAATQDIENISSPLEIVNPWLSACDLAQPATAPDLQGTCSTTTPVPANLWIRGPGPPERDKPPPAREQHAQHHEHSSSHPPLPCSPSSAHRNASTTSNQCLYYLEESHKKMVCDLGKARAWRHERIAELRLRHCSEHDLLSSLSNQLLENVLNGGEQCRYAITAILDTDALAARITCEFTEVLIRYDCGQPYSIVFNCDDCKVRNPI